MRSQHKKTVVTRQRDAREWCICGVTLLKLQRNKGQTLGTSKTRASKETQVLLMAMMLHYHMVTRES